MSKATDFEEKFLSTILDGVMPIPMIQERMAYYIEKSVHTENEVESEAYDAIAHELGWVLGLDEHEVDVLIEAKAIEVYMIDDSAKRYYDKMNERNKRIAEKAKSKK